jgi:hypothetical protein
MHAYVPNAIAKINVPCLKGKNPRKNAWNIKRENYAKYRLNYNVNAHLNHTHKDCRFKGENTNPKHPHMDKKHPNLGKAPPKKHEAFGPDKSKTTVSTKEPTSTKESAKEATGEGQRRCYICNSPSHLANACPQKATHKANSKKRLNNNKSFMAL